MNNYLLGNWRDLRHDWHEQVNEDERWMTRHLMRVAAHGYARARGWATAFSSFAKNGISR